jgi:DNA-binding transcriptional regulator WhiA
MRSTANRRIERRLFSEDAKDEIAAVRCAHTCCKRTFLHGFVTFSAVRSPGAHAGAVIRTSRAAAARAVLAAAHGMGLAAHARRLGSGTAGSWLVSIPSVSPAKATPTSEPPARTCCRRALLRAAFLAGGSVSDPARGYHLELCCRNDAAARSVRTLMARFGGDAGIARRRSRPVVYVKDAQKISTLLANMGATHALLRLEEVRALAQTKNAIRRTVNSEAANAKRAAAAAARQRDAARAVLGGRRAASSAVREAARLRIKHPSRTLAELGRLARPPITKAAMANRMRLLERLAER